MDVSTNLQVKTKEELRELLCLLEVNIKKHVSEKNQLEETVLHQATTLEHQATTLEHQATTLEHQATILEHQATTLEHQATTLEHQASKIIALEERIKQLLQEQYGTRSEKLTEPHADNAFDEAAVSTEEEAEIAAAEEAIQVAAYTRQKHSGGRKPLPAHLPREEIIYSLADEQKQCACGCLLTKIGDERSEQLEIIPAQIKVLVHVREKWACKGCEETIITATLPKHPIPKSIASAGLLAHVVVCKYEDHLPLYRQERILQRIGIDIPRSTLSHWLIRCGDLLSPLVTLMHTLIKKYDIAYADETPVQILKEKDRPAQKKSMMWYFAGGPPDKRCIVYEYHETRAGHIAATFFDDFKGYLHCDGYSGYEQLFMTQKIAHVACWAHARRKCVELIKTSKHPSGVAVTLINLIKKLYEIEKKCKAEALTPEHIYTRRQQDANPILLRIKAYLDEHSVKAPPQSAIAKAMNYMLNQWDSLMMYSVDGRLEIDNNASERGIKTFVIGRKNWLFFDQPAGATAGAVIYSLIQTCKLHEVEPYEYFKHVLKAIPYADTEEKLIALLPFNYLSPTLPAAA